MKGRGTRLRSTGRADYDSEYIPDTALTDSGLDRFEHRAVAVELANIARGAPTPYAVVVYAPWGAGKTSLGSFLGNELEKAPCRFACFNAWKHADEPLRRHFISHIAQELEVRDSRFHDDLYRTQSRTSPPTLRDMARSFGRILLLAALVMAAILFGASAIKAAFTEGVSFVSALGDLAVRYYTSLVVSGSMVALVYGLFGQLGAISTTRRPPAEEELEGRFRDLVNTALPRRDSGAGSVQRLVVFIDEIDRCRSSQVVAVLETLKTFLDAPRCVYVVAADREFLEGAISESLPKQRTESRRQAASAAAEYLDKIFQHQLTLPPLHVHRMSDYARTLVEDRGGVWAEARDKGLLDDLLDVLLPTHVRNPRRAKALLNGYVSLYRSTAVRKENRPESPDPSSCILELAKLSTLQLEFPRFYADLRRLPQLASYLAEALRDGDEENPIPEEVARRASHFEGLPEALTRWIRPSTDQLSSRRERERLVRYMERTAVIAAPSSNLVYMESLGASHGVDHDVASQCLSLALDRQSDELRALLAEHDRIADKVTAYLSSEARHRRGITRSNILDSLLALVQEGDIEPSALRLRCVRPLGELIERRAFADERLPAIIRVASGSPYLRPLVGAALIELEIDEAPGRAIVVQAILGAMQEDVSIWTLELSSLLRKAPAGTTEAFLRASDWSLDDLNAVFSHDAVSALSAALEGIESPESPAARDFSALCLVASDAGAASLSWALLSAANENESSLLMSIWLNKTQIAPKTEKETDSAIQAVTYAVPTQAARLAHVLKKAPKTKSSILLDALAAVRQSILSTGFTEDIAELWEALKQVWDSALEPPDEAESLNSALSSGFADADKERRMAAHAMLYEASALFDQGLAVLSEALFDDFLSFAADPKGLSSFEFVALVEESVQALPFVNSEARAALLTVVEEPQGALVESAARLWHWSLILASERDEVSITIGDVVAAASDPDWYDDKSREVWLREAEPSREELMSLLSQMRKESSRGLPERAFVWAAVAAQLLQLGTKAATETVLTLLSWQYPKTSKALRQVLSIPLETERVGRSILSTLRKASRGSTRKHMLRVWDAWNPDSATLQRSLARAMTGVVRRRKKGDLVLAIRYYHLVGSGPEPQKLASAMKGSARIHTDLKERVKKACAGEGR